MHGRVGGSSAGSPSEPGRSCSEVEQSPCTHAVTCTSPPAHAPRTSCEPLGLGTLCHAPAASASKKSSARRHKSRARTAGRSSGNSTQSHRQRRLLTGQEAGQALQGEHGRTGGEGVLEQGGHSSAGSVGRVIRGGRAEQAGTRAGRAGRIERAQKAVQAGRVDGAGREGSRRGGRRGAEQSGQSRQGKQGEVERTERTGRKAGRVGSRAEQAGPGGQAGRGTGKVGRTGWAERGRSACPRPGPAEPPRTGRGAAGALGPAAVRGAEPSAGSGARLLGAGLCRAQRCRCPPRCPQARGTAAGAGEPGWGVDSTAPVPLTATGSAGWVPGSGDCSPQPTSEPSGIGVPVPARVATVRERAWQVLPRAWCSEHQLGTHRLGFGTPSIASQQ